MYSRTLDPRTVVAGSRDEALRLAVRFVKIGEMLYRAAAKARRASRARDLKDSADMYDRAAERLFDQAAATKA